MSEIAQNRIGQRLSFDDSPCTVRYVGEISGVSGEWLGVEWDDPHGGKHAGSHQGIEYFKCRSDSSKAASFIRPRRPTDKPRDFVSAVRSKYISGEDAFGDTIAFNGKVAEEVGFDKIRHVQAKLQDLRVVLIDKQRLALPCLEAGATYYTADRWLQIAESIRSECPRIRQLDMSHNLLETLLDVACICQGLRELRILDVSDNRMRDLSVSREYSSLVQEAFAGVLDLSLNGSLLTCEELVAFTSVFTSLQTLSCAGNHLSSMAVPFVSASLQSINLAHNRITSINDIETLTLLPNLKSLSLHDNRIAALSPSPDFPGLRTLDISSNRLLRLSSLDLLAHHFPATSNLRVSGNPFFVDLAIDDAQMLCIARVPSISTLNHSDVGFKHRENAELYYLSRIVAELRASSVDEEPQILREHPLWNHLVRKYGRPTITRTNVGDSEPGTLAARLIRINLNVRCGDGAQVQKSVTVPNTVNIYTLKAIVADIIGILPNRFNLTWDTGEWDPVGSGGVNRDSDARFDVGNTSDGESALQELQEQGHWVKREVELLEGTSTIGFWIEGKEAQVRIEYSNISCSK